MLKITPLRTANIPPPMALHEVSLELGSPIVDVAFNESGSLLGVLQSDQVTFFSNQPHKRQAEPQKLDVIPIGEGEPYQIVSLGQSRFGFIAHLSDDNKSVIRTVNSGGPVVEIGAQHSTDQPSPPLSSIFTDIRRTEMFYQEETGKLGPVIEDITIQATKLPSLCPWVEAIAVNEQVRVAHGETSSLICSNLSNQVIIFGLSGGGKLYANSRLLVSNCTSFVLTPTELMFTTTNHFLKFVHLTDVEHLEVSADDPESAERCRSIERGARLLTAMPSAYSVVMQMPRGNLETIYPRALVLAGIRNAILAKDYKTAFLACRNQRVDMNILHDYDAQQFMGNAALFIQQVKRVDFIDLFLSQLRNEDVCTTIYIEKTRPTSAILRNGNRGSVMQNTDFQKSASNESKVNNICDAFLHVLEKDRKPNLQNIITANVCKSPPDLEGGLKVISELRERNDDLVEKAVEHICFLADVNHLYECALGTYDLDTALLIAQQSQKDPREYLPYLQSLQEMSSLRRQFTIDNDLGRSEKALSSLHEMGEFDELCLYTKKHELYHAAIQLCRYREEHVKELTRIHAMFLYSRNHFKDAGIAYDFLDDYASALPAYKAANLWREALCCATLLQLPPTELRSLAEEIALGLVESKDYSDAASVYAEYVQDIESACRMYCKAYLFADSMRLASLHNRRELLDSVVDTMLGECFSTTTELITDCKSQIGAQVPRLRELRAKKEQDPIAFYAGDSLAANGDVDIPDNVSLAPTDASTSGGTFMTRYTGRTDGTLNTQTSRRTSKHRRKEERKRATGKKGSVYEEEYLINSIGRLVERLNSTLDDVSRLIEALIRRGMRERAIALEKATVEVLQNCREAIPEVFQVVESKALGNEEDEMRPRGGDAVLVDALDGLGRKEPPVLKAFDGLSLLR